MKKVKVKFGESAKEEEEEEPQTQEPLGLSQGMEEDKEENRLKVLKKKKPRKH